MVEFFVPVSKAVLAHREVLPEGTLGKKMTIYAVHGDFPDIEKNAFAIIGVKENRNDVNYLGVDFNFDGYRKALYALYPGNWNRSIVDLGDIEKGDTVADTYFALQEVVSNLLKRNIIPLILGGSQDLAYGQYRGYDGVEHMINLANIDACFDIGDAEKPIHNKSYVGKIVVNEPYNLYNYSVLGYQSYFNSPEEIGLIDKLYFDAHRLGNIIADVTSVEPILRNAHMVTLDVTSIKSTALSNENGESPNGFDSREICAIARYAGIGNKLSSFGVYELSSISQNKNGAMLIAQIIWYFIEGVNFRVVDDNFNDEKCFLSYKVLIEDEILTFLKSKKTERWWIELPFILNVNNKMQQQALLPCTYGDYLSATRQQIPERWLKACRKNEV